MYYLAFIGGVIITVFQFVFFLRILTRLERRIFAIEKYIKETPPLNPSKVVNTEDQIATGLMRGMQMLREDDERTMQLLELSRKARNLPAVPMTTNSVGPEILDTGGELIPNNLTKEEEEILRMYYDKNNER